MQKIFILFVSIIMGFSAFAQKPINKALLIGKWQSTDDKQSSIEFTATVKIDYYSNKAQSSVPYTIKGDKLTAIEDGDKYEYNVEVSKDNLNMIYLGRGNTLSYTRIKTSVPPKSVIAKSPSASTGSFKMPNEIPTLKSKPFTFTTEKSLAELTQIFKPYCNEDTFNAGDNSLMGYGKKESCYLIQVTKAMKGYKVEYSWECD